ncbi:MAG: pitrilysin family protein [Pirellulales bacterium]
MTALAPQFTAPAIFSHTLANGLVLVGEPTDAYQSAAFSFLIPAGCCYESRDRAGLSALTCEMMLRGAGSRDSRQLVSDLENLGVERDEGVGVSQASYSAATLGDNLFAALEIYADLLRRPHLPKDQLDAGRQVCLLELRGVEDDPGQKLMIELRRRHYPDPWGRPSQGRADSLQAATANDVRKFFATNYQPAGTILAAAGNFDWPRLREQVERLFGDWAPVKSAKLIDAEPANGVPHIPYESTQSHIGIAFPSVPYRHPDYFQAWAAVGVLSGGMSARLFTEVREKRGLCYTVSASLQSQRERGSVFCYAGTTAERAQETLDVTHAELVKLSAGIQQSELDRLKARIKSSLIMQQESTSARCSSLARDWYHLGRARTVTEVGKLVDDLSANSINAYLAANPPEDFTFLTLGPEPLEIPLGVS